MNGRLILVKHSLPEIKEDLPAREWRLSEEGRLRARRLAEKLSSYPIDFLFSSNEQKARETAQMIAEKCGLELQVVNELHEHERTQVPYLSKLEFEAAVQAFFKNPDTLVFGSETANQTHARFSRAVYSVLAGKDDRSIAIVSHGTVISLFVSRLTGRSDYQLWTALGLPGYIVLDMQLKRLIAIESIL